MDFELVQWQKLDTNGVCYPWFTHPFLEVLKTWDLSDKNILEWGGGKSSLWWNTYANYVCTIETNPEWAEEILRLNSTLNKIFRRPILREVKEGDQNMVEFYTEIPNDCHPDIVVIDGILRHECLIKALTLPRPLIIIHDNWQQDGFVCPASEKLMAPYEIHNFIQEDHTDNHGRKWATAYWELK